MTAIFFISEPINNLYLLFALLFSEPAISTPHCSRLYGIFADENKCDVFWNCWNGEASRYQCSPGLAYDREARVCMWADQVPECKNEGTYKHLIIYTHTQQNTLNWGSKSLCEQKANLKLIRQ